MNPKHKKTQYFSVKGLFEGLSSFNELENRISSLPEVERGDAFEVFAEAYFKTQDLHQIQEIWPEKVLPQSLRDVLGVQTDAGVDGVFKTHSGLYTAYQVKFRTNRVALTWDNDGLGKFFGQTDRVDKRVLFTNSVDLSHVTNTRADFYSVKGTELDNLNRSDFQAIDNWLKTGVIIKNKKTLYSYQREAVNDILRELNTNDRTTAVMACGSGKTLVALSVAEKIEAKTILVLLPSLALIKQTLRDWADDNNWDSFNFLCVCSDITVIQGSDEIVLQQYDLDFPVTTQQEVVEAFLLNKDTPRKIIFSTYQSCQIVAQAMPQTFSFDLAIFDEAHKTASRQGTNYAFALRDSNLSIKKRLFLTATPRHYNLNKKDKEGEQQLVFSMDDQATYGRIAHQLSFRAAVKQNIICDYKVIISVVTSEMINRELLKRGEVIVEGDAVKALRIANILAIERAVKEYGMKRIFSFHSSVQAAKSFTAKTNEGIGIHLKDFVTLHVNGEMSTNKRDALLKEFKESEKAIISNARCLTEGVNVPAVDMVAFVSPKKSKVDIVQAAGRAMRKHGDKKCGYILIPLFMQMADDESFEQALSKTKFETVWDVLQAMQEQDESLVEIIAQLREARGKALGINDNRLRERVEILGPELLLDDLRDAIATQIIDQLGSGWDERLGELIKFKGLFGHCNVSQLSQQYRDLGSWVTTQRRVYNAKKMSSERIKKLEAIGFEWDPLSNKWASMFTALSEYRKKYGTCNVPQNYSEDLDLGVWVSMQRCAYKAGKILQDRIEKLESIGFEWDQFSEQWEKMFIQLSEYREKNGDCFVPRDFSENIILATWVSDQRKMYNKGKLSQHRITKLESIDFHWDPLDQVWDAKFAELCKYQQMYGNDIPAKFSKHHKLAIWMQHQRNYYKKGRLSIERITKLESIRFDWDPLNNTWHTRFAELRKYKEVHGNCDVPSKYFESPLLRSWVCNQRTYYKQKKLSNERIILLESIGFVWESLDQQWENMFNELNKHYTIFGHPNVPKRYNESHGLGTWCQGQRNAYKNKKLSPDRINKLTSIGFCWDPLAEQWERMFVELFKYYGEYGNCDVPHRYSMNPTLGLWVGVQRRAYKKNKLLKEYINRLESIEFDWAPLTSSWDEMFYKLCKYREIHGDCNVSSKCPENPILGRWVHNQRMLYKQKKLTQDRIDRLNGIGFLWKIKF
jgi:superfamily II DNA or RNA helicase